MVTSEQKANSDQKKINSKKTKKVAVACQGGGMHAAFEVGVLTEILKDVDDQKFELVGLSGTSAGALCALMVWYGLAPKDGSLGSVGADASKKLNEFWNGFVAKTGAETVLNFFTYRTFRAEEMEIPGRDAPLFAGGFSPYGLATTRGLPPPHLGMQAMLI
jgi:NTE family protein